MTRLLRENPFAEVKGGNQTNQARFHFVTREDADKVLAACPNAEWRLIFALARFGGLRTPSETLALRWEDVNWAENRLRVRSSKTEHHPGCESRMIPLYPELRPYLEAAFDQAEPGSIYAITTYRDPSVNLRNRLLRIVRAAGLEEWRKLFANLRSTRQTELNERSPTHVVCAWIGNSQPVALRHYLQITDQHFRQAAEGDGKAARKTAQYLPEPGCKGRN